MTRADAMVLRIVVDNKQAKRELKEFSGGMDKAGHVFACVMYPQKTVAPFYLLCATLTP